MPPKCGTDGRCIMARIELDRVGVTFKVRQYNKLTLKEFLVRRMFRRTVNPHLEVPALRDVTLSVAEGDRLGIIGDNGARQSTLLKGLAGIYPPTAGVRLAGGRISSLFDIALGCRPDPTGWGETPLRRTLRDAT